MKLFLASEAGNGKSLKDIDEFVGGLGKAAVAYVVTAHNGSLGYGSWRKSETLELVRKMAKDFEVVELENYRFVDPVELIKRSSVVWFAGGMSGYLLYWIRRVGLDEKLSEILTKIIYVGSSAGAMIASRTQHVAEIYPGDEERGAQVIPGLGLVDFEIWPHFEESQMELVRKIWRYEAPLYLLKNGEAITVVDGKVEILGKERIILMK